MRLSRILITSVLLGLLGGCSLFGVDKRDYAVPEPKLWQQALTALEENNFSIAVDKLEELESRYPFGRFSQQAQLELIYAYLNSQEATKAKASADRFIRLHPRHENIDYAYYLRGLASYEADNDITMRYLPTDSGSRDPGAARESFNDFSTLLNEFPNSQYAPDARKRMIHLRNRLAAYEVAVARFYMKRGAYIAAANRGRYVVENFQRTPAVAEALHISIQAYEKLGLQEPADNARAVLDANFPGYGQPTNTPQEENESSGLTSSPDNAPAPAGKANPVQTSPLQTSPLQTSPVQTSVHEAAQQAPRS